MDCAFTAFACSLFQYWITRLAKKCFLISVRLCCTNSLSLWPLRLDLFLLKNESFFILYLSFIILYVSFKSMAFLRSCRLGNLMSFFHSFSHRRWVFSRTSISFWSHGLHAGEQYSSMGRISAVYKLIITSGERFEKHLFIIPRRWFAYRVGLSVRLSVRPSVCHRFLVRARTFERKVIETWL